MLCDWQSVVLYSRDSVEYFCLLLLQSSGLDWSIPQAQTWLLYKPLVLCCLLTRSGCMDYWCQHRGREATHGKDTQHIIPPTIQNISHVFYSAAAVQKAEWSVFFFFFFVGDSLSTYPTLQFLCSSSQLHIHYTPTASSPFDFAKLASQMTRMYVWICSVCWSHSATD